MGRGSVMRTARRQQVSLVLAALWLAGALSVGLEKFTPQWTTTHCPQGQTHGAQHSPNHCVWHCGGIHTQGAGVRGETSVDAHVRRVRSLSNISPQDAGLDSEFPSRGPPQLALQIAQNRFIQ
ncbi:MAG: hypothetical protein OJF51_001694 [Nitrospira sp.]|jgi:hypothetical protein|nr:MAG: hypothetical protein OJF51_001694 [Nitrospira sp.]